MRKIKFPLLALFLLLSAPVCVLHAQTTTRPTTPHTGFFTYDANPVAAGYVRGTANTYFITFSGKASTRDSSVASTIDIFNITLQYTPNGDGTGTVIGGTWTMTQRVKDRPARTSGGAIEPGATIALRPDSSVGAGSLFLILSPGNPDWPIFGTLNATTDRSSPARVKGELTLTWPVAL